MISSQIIDAEPAMMINQKKNRCVLLFVGKAGWS